MRYTRTMPQEGSFKEVKKFAFFPTTITTEKTTGVKVKSIIWLEYYRIEYHYYDGSWRLSWVDLL